MINKFSLIFLLVVLAACGSETTHQETKTHSHSVNQHMNEEPFESLISRFEDSNRIEWQKPMLVISKLDSIKNKTIADIGAGSGYFSFRLAQKGAEVLALDVDDRFLTFMKEKKISLNDHLVTPIKIPFDNPQLDTNSIDAAIIVNTYHHIENRIDYFRKVEGALVKGGRLLVVDFKDKETPHGPPVEMRLSGLEVLKELQKAGFSKTIIDVTSLNEQYIITAKKRIY